MIKNKDLEYFIGPMETNIKVSGLMENSMDKENIIQKIFVNKEYGKMEIFKNG